MTARIAVDAMGGDYAPGEIIAGALEWIRNNDTLLVLVGDEETIRKELAGVEIPAERLEIVHASQVVDMKESATAVLRSKKDSSIAVATRLVKEGRADALVSCGNTGAQMAAALFVLGRFEGVERPPVIAAMPGLNGGTTYVIDVGANVDCKPAQLVQFALLGSVYASLDSGYDSPRVALLNNGEEESKGNALAVEAHQRLKNHPAINFAGNIEGRGIFSGQADVIVCDGFTGNILLKSVEGMAAYWEEMIRREKLERPVFMDAFNYSKAGGAPLLGVDGISIVCHGSSRREAVYNGIRVACECLGKDLVKRQKEALAVIATGE